MTFANPMLNIFTDDIEAALRFYGEQLGMTESFRTPTEGTPEHVELRLDGVTLALSTVEAARRVHGIEALPGSRGFELVVWTEDVDTSYDALVAAGARGIRGPQDSGNDNRNALVHDPDGNLVELVSKRG